MIIITELNRKRLSVRYELNREKTRIVEILNFFIVMYELRGTNFIFFIPEHYRELLLTHLNQINEGN